MSVLHVLHAGSALCSERRCPFVFQKRHTCSCARVYTGGVTPLNRHDVQFAARNCNGRNHHQRSQQCNRNHPVCRFLILVRLACRQSSCRVCRQELGVGVAICTHVSDRAECAEEIDEFALFNFSSIFSVGICLSLGRRREPNSMWLAYM